MTKKLYDGLFSVPEICSQFDINWETYEVAGGKDWLDFYRNELKPTFEKALAGANKEIALIKEKSAQIAEIRKGIKTASESAKLLEEFCGKNKGVNILKAVKIIEWVRLTKSIAEDDIFVKDESRFDVSEIESDITFIKAVIGYFETDFELDAVLYAMYKVEAKYKAKLFRHVIRLLPVIDASRAVVQTSTAPIKGLLGSILNPSLENLNAAYDKVSKNLRKLKKEAGKGASISFWESVI